MAESSRETVIHHILKERERQIAKWGNPQHHHAWWYVILGEEVGEVANALQEVEDQKSADVAEHLLLEEGMLPGERNEIANAGDATSDGRFMFDFDVDPHDYDSVDEGTEPPAQLMVSVPSPVVRGVWRGIKYVSVDALASALEAAGLLPTGETSRA